MLAGRLAGAVGDEHRNITACTGDSTDEGADKAAGKDVGPDLTDGFEIRQHIGDLFLRLLLLLLAADDALHAGDDLGDGEQTDQCGDELEAVQQADGRDQIHTKRERNEQRHTHGGGHARDRAQQNAAVQAVPLPKKADFYASAAQAQQSPYLSAACFSVLLFPLFTVPRLFAAVCIFSRKRPKAAYPKYAVLEAEL